MALAAEVASTQPSRRAFVRVYPINAETETFRIRFFEVDRDELERYRQHDWAITESNLRNQRDVVISGREALETTLSQWLDDLGKLVLPTFTDYPL
jgi:hypothetical protein